MPNVSSFGSGGTRTVQINVAAVLLTRADDDFVSYKISVSGAAGVFVFSNGQREILRADQFPGHPLADYTWTLRQADLPDNDETFTVAFSFTGGALKYKLLVEHCRRNGSVIEVLKDLDLESTEPADSLFDAIRVFVV